MHVTMSTRKGPSLRACLTVHVDSMPATFLYLSMKILVSRVSTKHRIGHNDTCLSAPDTAPGGQRARWLVHRW